jgi:methylmalonyl-CoA/ethylmalonyl-CoA epimerase
MFDGIDHVGIAVAEIDSALALYRDTLSMELVHRERVEDHDVEIAMLRAGDGQVELVAPLGADTAVGRFLAARGSGLHHVAYRVSDIDAALEELRAREVELIDATPRRGARSSRIAFVDPRSAGGVLTELVEPGAAPA